MENTISPFQFCFLSVRVDFRFHPPPVEQFILTRWMVGNASPYFGLALLLFLLADWLDTVLVFFRCKFLDFLINPINVRRKHL